MVGLGLLSSPGFGASAPPLTQENAAAAAGQGRGEHAEDGAGEPSWWVLGGAAGGGAAAGGGRGAPGGRD